MIEAAGAVLLLAGFFMGLQRKGNLAVSLSFYFRFCNAGFDILGTSANPFPSLTGYSANVLINVVIMLLIIIGGIGFLTWDDIYTNKMKFKRYRMQSKIILVTTACLILIPIIFFFTCDLKKSIRRESLISCGVPIGNYKNCRI